LLVGHLRLSSLCWIYDNNGITLEGGTQGRSKIVLGDGLRWAGMLMIFGVSRG